MNNRKTPRIRFKEYTDDWEQRKVGQLTNVLSASRVHKEEWAEDGVPFFRSSDVVSAFKGTENEKAFISVELYEQLAKSSGKLEKNDILITGGGSIGIPYIMPDNKPLYSKDADLIWIKHSANFDSIYLYTYFMSEEFREYLASISHTGTIAHYTIEQVKDTPVRLPSIDEQRKLGNFFVSLDHLITLHQRKLEKLKIVKKAMLENCFPKNGEKVPKFRFSGFTGDWEQRKLGEIVERVTRKNENFESALPLTISAQYGLIDQNEFFDKRIASKDVSGYYLVRKGEFAYNKSTSSDAPWGAIKRLDKYESGVLSTLYIVFQIRDESIIDSDYLVTYYDTDLWHKGVQAIAAEGARNHGLLNIAPADFFETTISMPKNIEEQRKIGAYFKHLDHLITLHQRKLEKLKIIKKSFLEKMFV